MVGHAALDRGIGVRIPASQPVLPPTHPAAEPCRIEERGEGFEPLGVGVMSLC